MLNRALPVLLGVVLASLIFSGIELTREGNTAQARGLDIASAEAAAPPGDGLYVYVGLASLVFAVFTYFISWLFVRRGPS